MTPRPPNRPSKLLLAALLLAAAPLLAQIPLAAPAAPPSSPASPVDPLGRTTPRGAVIGFLQAAQGGHYREAARYLQLTPAALDSTGPKLARELKALMDAGFSSNLDAISNRPEGSFDDGLSPNQERIGVFHNDNDFPLILNRIADPQAGQIWLFSAETVRNIPTAYTDVGFPFIESSLPDWMVQREWLGVPIWKWPATLLLFPIVLGVSWLVVALFLLPARFRRNRNKPRAALLESWRSTAIAPVVLLLAMLLHRISITILGIPVLYRYYYRTFMWIVILLIVSWLAWRLIDRGSRIALNFYQPSSTLPVATSLLMLGRRLLKALVITFAVTGVLAMLGFEMRTVIAGVGIGGIAVALAAQKTLENVFGGVSMLGDRVIQIGDVLQIGTRTGTVEDIGLRSTRIRTVERTELSIPNGSLSQVNLENLSRRDKILFNPVMQLRMETTANQLLYVLAELRKVLYQHPKVERESARVRLANFDDSGYRIEFFSYVLTRDFGEFTAIREDLLIRFLAVLESAGAGLAYPSRTLYVSRDHGQDPKRAADISAQVNSWRNTGELPFPDFAPETIERMRGTLPYPPKGSALHQDGASSQPDPANI